MHSPYNLLKTSSSLLDQVWPLLGLLAADRDWHVCAAAADALGDIGSAGCLDPELQAAVVAALTAAAASRGEDEWVVRNAAEALGSFGAAATGTAGGEALAVLGALLLLATKQTCAVVCVACHSICGSAVVYDLGSPGFNTVF
jgi:hypothetical protein